MAPGKLGGEGMGYSDDERLRGVAGWLAFLCIIFIVLSPARTLILTWIELAKAERETPGLTDLPIWGTIKLYSLAFAVIAAALSIYTGWRLNKVHRPSSVRLAMAMLWVLGPLLVLLDTAIASAAFGVPFSMDAEGWRDLLRGIVGATIWTAYLALSRRVKNTYYADEDEEGDIGDAAG